MRASCSRSAATAEGPSRGKTGGQDARSAETWKRGSSLTTSVKSLWNHEFIKSIVLRSSKMQVRVSHDDEKMFTVEVTGEDYSLAEIVHHELLNEKNVTFAGVVPPHPLLKKLILKVRAQRIKPEKAFVTSVERAESNTHELLEATQKVL